MYPFTVLQQRPIKQSFCGSLRRDTHWKCLILSVLICGCLAAIAWCRLTVITRYVINFYKTPITQTAYVSPCDDGYIYIPVAFVVMLYLVYLVECWHSHTRIELQYKVDVNSVYERIQAMREALPIVWWKSVCYHYVRRTRQVTRYRNGDAFTTTQVYYERVNSHTASSAFNFSHCGIKDISKNLVNLEGYPATKIKFSKGFSFATVEAENEFEDQRARFFHEHERRDDYMETREGLDLLNVSFKEYMIAFADPDNLPWYVSHIVFWVASLLMLSWPLRVCIEYKTAYVHYHVHKLFGCNYLDSSYCPGTMSRVSTMGSSELEMNIRNNYTLVPSYSEALLMENCYNQQTQDPSGNVTPSSIGNGYLPGGAPNGAIPNGVAVAIPNGHISLANCGVHIPNGPAVIANSHVHNGIIPNSVMIQNVHVGLHNGHIPNGGVPVILNLRTIAREEEVVGDIGTRSQRRRRKTKRSFHQHSQENVQGQSDTDGGPEREPIGDPQAPVGRHGHRSHTPTLATTPESPESQVDVILEYEELEPIAGASESPNDLASPEASSPVPDEDEEVEERGLSLDEQSPETLAEHSVTREPIPPSSTSEEAECMPRRKIPEEQLPPWPDSARYPLTQSHSTPLQVTAIDCQLSLPHSSTCDLTPDDKFPRCTYLPRRHSSAHCDGMSCPSHIVKTTGSQSGIHSPQSSPSSEPSLQCWHRQALPYHSSPRHTPPSQVVSPRNSPSPHASPHRPGAPFQITSPRHAPSPPLRTPSTHSSTPCQSTSPSPHASPRRSPSRHSSPRHVPHSIHSSPHTSPSPHSSPRRAPSTHSIPTPPPPPEVPPPAYEEALTMRVVQEGPGAAATTGNVQDEITELTESPRISRRRNHLRCMETSL